MEEVCIIGAGFSGILSAKISLSNNLIPFVLEKQDSIGGLWNPSPNHISVWNSLQTNLSKYAMTISDHLWPPSTPEFPSHNHMIEYFNSYISKHNLLQFIHFNTTVISVSKQDDDYSVAFVHSNETVTKVFKYVICASGAHAVVNDDYKNKEVFRGKIVHSGFYRDPEEFVGKNVIVVGRGVSSGDIGLDVSEAANSVTHLYRNTYACLTKHLLGAPHDFTLFNIKNRNIAPPLTLTLERNAGLIKLLITLVGNPGDYHEDWRITDEELGKKYFRIAVQPRAYLEAVRNNKIHCVRGNFKEFCENGIVLEDGQVLQADVVVLATGYSTNLSYLSEEIKEMLKYEPGNLQAPLTLFRSVIHPALPRLAFSGLLYGPLVGSFELQSELAVRWITGQLNVSAEELWEGVRVEENARVELKNAGFLYDLQGILKDLIRILDIKIDFEFLESLGYTSGPFCPVFFWKDREGQEELIRQFVSEITAAYPEFRFNS